MPILRHSNQKWALALAKIKHYTVSDFINNMFYLIRKEYIDDDNKVQLEQAQYLDYINI